METRISRQEVVNILERIFKLRFNIEFDGQCDGMKDKPLLGKEMRLAPRDLLYLYFDVEREFGMTIPEEDIITGRFGSYNSILEIICDYKKAYAA